MKQFLGTRVFLNARRFDIMVAKAGFAPLSRKARISTNRYRRAYFIN
jgi:hypothetical protein